MGRKIVIVGGGAAGSTAAQFARKTDRKAEITIFEAGKYSQYSKCALPYLVSKSLNNVIEFDKEWFKRANIELLLETMVESIDLKSRKVVARNGKHTVERWFDTLVIATGAKPAIPPIKGIKNGNNLADGVFSLRTLDDALAISSYTRQVKHVTVIGGGAIGLEMAEALHSLGMKVTVVEMLSSILPGMLDADMADIFQRNMPDGIETYTNHRVVEVLDRGNHIRSVVVEDERKDRKTIDTDMVLLSAGIRPDTEVAESIGCRKGKKGGILVDERCQTNISDIYAVGDCTEYYDFVTKKPFAIGLGSIAVRQGIVAGINAAGGDARLPEGFLQTRTTKLFGVEIAAVGPTSNQIEKKTIAGRFTGSSLPDYFPGGSDIAVKVIVDPDDGSIIGAQAVGENAAQRINVFACAIMNSMSVNDFVKMETAYAPPVAPTLDPITIACDVARMRYGRR